MTATAHAIFGTVIAAKIGNPALAIPIALVSHVAADMIPHWDTATNGNGKGKSPNRVLTDTMIDVGLGFILSYFLIIFISPQTNLLYALIIIIFAQLPDWLMAPYYFFKIKFFKWAYDFGKITNKDLDKPWGIFTQIATVALVILLGKLF